MCYESFSEIAPDNCDVDGAGGLAASHLALPVVRRGTPTRQL